MSRRSLGEGGSPRFLSEPYAKPGSGVKNWDGRGWSCGAVHFCGDFATAMPESLPRQWRAIGWRERRREWL